MKLKLTQNYIAVENPLFNPETQKIILDKNVQESVLREKFNELKKLKVTKCGTECKFCKEGDMVYIPETRLTSSVPKIEIDNKQYFIMRDIDIAGVYED